MMDQLKTSADNTLFVGDSLTDIQAAKAAGCTAILVRTGQGKNTEPHVASLGIDIYDDLAAFSHAVLAN